MKNNITYENAISELEKIASDMRSNNISVEDLSEKVRRAFILTDYCKSKLSGVENELNNVIGVSEQDIDDLPF